MSDAGSETNRTQVELKIGEEINGRYFTPGPPLAKFAIFCETNFTIYHWNDTPIQINITVIVYIVIALAFSLLLPIINQNSSG